MAYYILRNPRLGKQGLGCFAIYRQEPLANGHTANIAVQDPVLDKINKDYRIGALRFDQAKCLAKELLDQLRAKESKKGRPKVWNTQNERDAELYWNIYYRQKRLLLRAPDSALYDIKKAVRAVGACSLRTGSMAELQDAIESAHFPPDIQRRIVGRLSSILKFLGRNDVDLLKHRPQPKVVQFITVSELNTIVSLLDTAPFRLLVQLAFYTGCRLGELMALQAGDLSAEGYLLVSKSLSKKGKLGPTKNGKIRRVYVFPKGRELFAEFLDCRPKLTRNARESAARIVKRACQKAFPDRPEKWINFHALRHSYAIACLEGGLTISEIALFLGDQERVVREYYIGFIASDAVLERAKRMLGG